jgi:hypothetical protein
MRGLVNQMELKENRSNEREWNRHEVLELLMSIGPENHDVTIRIMLY